MMLVFMVSLCICENGVCKLAYITLSIEEMDERYGTGMRVDE